MSIEGILAPWTADLAAAAQAEGWDLFTTTDSTSDVQIQRIDDPEYLPAGAPHLSCDDAALVIVAAGTGKHHDVARRIIHDHFPVEWALMLKAVENFKAAQEGK